MTTPITLPQRDTATGLATRGTTSRQDALVHRGLVLIEADLVKQKKNLQAMTLPHLQAAIGAIDEELLELRGIGAATPGLLRMYAPQLDALAPPLGTVNVDPSQLDLATPAEPNNATGPVVGTFVHLPSGHSLSVVEIMSYRSDQDHWYVKLADESDASIVYNTHEKQWRLWNTFYRDDAATRDMLLLASYDVPLGTIALWTDSMCEEAEQWAGATHIAASDNDDFPVPVRPSFLTGYEQVTQYVPAIATDVAPSDGSGTSDDGAVAVDAAPTSAKPARAARKGVTRATGAKREPLKGTKTLKSTRKQK